MQNIIADELRELSKSSRLSDRESHLLCVAASEIERLVDLAARSLEEAHPVKLQLPTDRFDAIDKRLALLESAHRLTQHRLAATAQMCADIDRDPRVHTSVQACFSHVGKALESEPQEDDGHV